MSTGEYLAGAVFFALMLAGVLAGTSLLVRRRLPRLAGVERIVAFGLIASLGVLAVHLGPLMLGILSRWTVVIAAAVWAAAAWRTPAVARTEPDRAPEPTRPSGIAAWGLAGIALTAIGLFVLLWARTRLSTASGSIDWLNFHMPGVAAWIQSGSIWQIDVYLPDLAPGHYPGNGDIMFLATVLPWRDDFLAHFAIYPFLALTGLATYALAAEMRAPRAAAAAAAAALIAMTSVLQPVLAGGLVDAVMLFGFATGLLFLVRHARTGQTADLVLAGLALGLSFGTKWYAVSSVAVVIGIWAVAMLIGRRGLGTVVRQGAALCGLTALGGGIWLIRNWVESSNPVFPVKVELLGHTLFDAPPDPIREASGFTIAHYFDQPDVWGDTILPQLRDSIGGPGVLAVAGVLAAVVALLAGRRRNGDGLPLRGIALAGIAAFVILTVAYTVTPYSAGGPEGLPIVTAADARYWVPALLVAVAVAAWAAGAWRHGPVIFSFLALVAVAYGLERTKVALSFFPSKGQAATVVAALLGLVAVAVAVVPALLPLQGRSERRALAALAAAAALVVLVAGAKVQDNYEAKRYFGQDAVADTLLSSGGSGNDVGLVGAWTSRGIVPPLPAFGPRFRNDVHYVGRPDKGVFRRFRTKDGFVAAVDRGNYDLLVIGQGTVPTGKPPREEAWAKAAGYRLIKRSPQMALYLRG